MRERVALYSRNTLKLGLFGANCSSGRAVTKPDSLRLAKLEELEAGFWRRQR